MPNITQIVPIVFCSDGNYGRYLPVAAQSIIENSSLDHEYHIIIFDCGIAPADIAVLERQIAKYSNFSLKVENITVWLDKQQHIAAKSGWNRAIYGRLLVPELCADYEKVIYADADMIFNRDTAELAQIDLGDAYIAAVPSIAKEIYRANGDKKEISFIRNILGMGDNQAYINSGLVVYNIRAWRTEGLADKVLQVLAAHNMRFPDQDAINAVCRGHIHYLNQCWNCVIHAGDKWQRLAGRHISSDVRALYDQWLAAYATDNAVLHYCGVKPWVSLSVPKGDIWWRYARAMEIYDKFLAAAITGSDQRELASKSAPVCYRLFGVLPLLTVRAWPWGRKYYLGSMRHRHIAELRIGSKDGRLTFYLLYLPIFSRR